MTKILTYGEIDKHQWQALVDQSSTATWFQTPEAYDFYISVPSEMMPHAIGVEENGVLKGVVVIYLTKEKNPIKQFLTRRAIIVGGPLIADDISDEALATLLMTIRQLGDKAKGKKNSKAVTIASTPYALHSTPIYIEARNFHDYSQRKSVFEKCGFAYQPHLNIQVACNAQHQMSEQRIRQVKKALKNGVEICQAESEADVKVWYQILQQLYRKKVRTPLWNEVFFLQFYRDSVGKYLLVKHEGKIIGGMMCPILEGKTIYEWYVCGLDEDFREYYPSVVATYAAIEYAKEHKLPLFDFMGAGKPDVPYGVRDFKMEFGGELVEHGRYVCVQKPLLYKIGQWSVKWLKCNRDRFF